MSIARLRDVRCVLALLMMTAALRARAEDLPQPAQPTPAVSVPRGQRGGRGARGGSPPAPQATAEQHKLPPDPPPKQTLELPGRTLAFPAPAASTRLFDGKGEPQADIAYTAYQL